MNIDPTPQGDCGSCGSSKSVALHYRNSTMRLEHEFRFFCEKCQRDTLIRITHPHALVLGDETALLKEVIGQYLASGKDAASSLASLRRAEAEW